LTKNYQAFTKVDEEKMVVMSSLLFKDSKDSGYVDFTIVHNHDDELCLRDELIVRSLLYPKDKIVDRLLKAVKILFYGEASLGSIHLSYSDISRLKGFVNGKTFIKKANFITEE
jgi:hypothetical protein